VDLVAGAANLVFRISGRYATVWPSLHATLGVFLEEKRQVYLYAQKMLRDRDPVIRKCGADILQILGEDPSEVG
jgi:hypothetical protein